MIKQLRLGFCTSVLLLSATSMVQAGPPPSYFVDETKLAFDAMPGATAYSGVHNNAGYRIEVPDNWNGRLVMWAHGFRGTGLELTVDNHPLRPLLISQGYAWAASSYSKNDYDITVGVQDTHALVELFGDQIGEPELVYLTGVSMGGHIAVVSIEQYRNTYDAAMPLCGALADFELFDYFLDFNVAAQQLGLGTSDFPVDPALYIGLQVPQIKANLEVAPGTWPFTLNTAGENHKSLVEVASGGERPNFDEAYAFWNSIPSATGSGNFMFELGLGDGSLPRSPGNSVENVDTVYQFDSDPALTPAEQDLNDNVIRVISDRQARAGQGIAQLPAASGDISIPVLILHNLGDLFVPVHNEIEYAERVRAAGAEDFLVQRAIRGVGHCDFTGTELATGFFDLVAWTEFGVKPAGDDFLDPAAVADSEFGCTFTDGAHLLATPCN